MIRPGLPRFLSARLAPLPGAVAGRLSERERYDALIVFLVANALGFAAVRVAIGASMAGSVWAPALGLCVGGLCWSAWLAFRRRQGLPAEGPPPPRRPRSVLVVEDDPDGRLMLARIFLRAGADVRVAAGVAEALGAVAAAVPDVIFLDLNLPDASGDRVLEYVRSRALPSEVYVTTGVSDSARLEAVQRYRPDAVLVKPYDVTVLLEIVQGEGKG